MFLDIQYINLINNIKNGVKLVNDDRERKLELRKAKDKQKDLMLIKNLNNEASDE
jgi:hypothetical protein